MLLRKLVKISVKLSTIKLGTSSWLIQFDGLKLRIFCSALVSEIEGRFKKSKKVKWALIGITRGEKELKI
jgi:hypothetical protein